MSAVVAVACLGACSRGPRIEFRHLTDAQLVQQSPIIVVGPILKRETFWTERKRYGNKDGHALYWYHTNIRISVENVLRGSVGATNVEYTYWTPAESQTGEWNSPWEGGRYVHFLREEDGHLRSVVDFWLSSIRITTGRHQVYHSSSVEQTIAELLLVPGDDFVVDHFNLPMGYSHAGQLVGYPATLRLIEPLAHHSDARLRKEACVELHQDVLHLEEFCDQLAAHRYKRLTSGSAPSRSRFFDDAHREPTARKRKRPSVTPLAVWY